MLSLVSLALLGSDDRHRPPFQEGNAPHHGRIIPDGPISVEFEKVIKDEFDVIEAGWPPAGDGRSSLSATGSGGSRYHAGDSPPGSLA